MDESHAPTADLWPGSSSSPVSTPPKSPVERDGPRLTPLRDSDTRLNDGIAPAAKGKKDAANGSASVRKPRKKREEVAAAAAAGQEAASKSITTVKERKARKPRDNSAKPSRKKQRLSEETTTPILAQSQPTTAFSTSAVGATSKNTGLQPLLLPASAPRGSDVAAAATTTTATLQSSFAQTSPISQSGKNEAEQKPHNQAAAAATTTTTTYSEFAKQHIRPASGQRYDPIRSASAENAAAANLFQHPSRVPSPHVLPHARSSPSIASLIDGRVSVTPASGNRSSHSSPKVATVAVAHDTGVDSPALAPAKLASSISDIPPHPTPDSSLSTSAIAAPLPPTVLPETNGTAVIKSGKADSGNDVPSPKPLRQKQAPPPLPLGSGLLSSAAFGKSEAVQHDFVEVPNQCIVIEVPMNQENGNYVNFMKEVEAKYGFDIAHPRLAEHRRRMAQIAAAGAALESGNGSADEMPLDDSDGESNAEMGGLDEDSTAGEGKRKRRSRANAYDKNDDFIDDTELMWEEQALASRDGYFVWSGPLIPEPEKMATERADGSAPRRGRGRGRGGSARGDGAGRGTRGGGGGAGGGGRGSRGGATARKPRVTKADRAKMEAEKEERAKTAPTVMRPTSYPEVTA